ncbi:hypothetical protein [Frateuria sp. Soil773]|uniref:hypothetical protein n=1 Tax=Frateuria sp. Soil773 TaxID=1736407 RepID=UPI0012F88E33|nr:hypothetical protein [Frateuria sp. Soil773]
MSSIWTNLLFLHGHVTHSGDLAWRPDAPRDEAGTRARPAAQTPSACETPDGCCEPTCA